MYWIDIWKDSMYILGWRPQYLGVHTASCLWLEPDQAILLKRLKENSDTNGI